MLPSISWPQYVAAVLLLSAAWYAWVGLRFYRPELSRLLRIEPKSGNLLPQVAAAHPVMGAARADAGTGLSEPDELIFGLASDDEVSDQTLPLGPSDELLAEAETLIGAFQENDDKAGFLSLFRVLLGKYEVFSEEISLPRVIAALPASKLPFEIKAEEWPQTFAS